MQRRVDPEILDDLPVLDPRAIGSRRDLERLNAWMRHPSIMARVLEDCLRGRDVHQIAELGAGDGKFMLRVAERLARRWHGVRVRLVDRLDAPRPETLLAFEALSWKAEAFTADVFEGLEQSIMAGCEIIIANLFLHHFTAARLGELFARIAERSRVFVALEPNRSAVALGLSRWVRMIGCNEITRHDAPVSVHAGFAGNELSRLWPDNSRWRLRECSIGLCSHLFVAERCETGASSVDLCAGQ